MSGKRRAAMSGIDIGFFISGFLSSAYAIGCWPIIVAVEHLKEIFYTETMLHNAHLTLRWSRSGGEKR